MWTEKPHYNKNLSVMPRVQVSTHTANRTNSCCQL